MSRELTLLFIFNIDNLSLARQRSRAKDDVYATFEPTLAYHARIEYCLKAHDEAVQVCMMIDD